MPLVDIDTGKEIDPVPYGRQLDAIRKKLSDAEFQPVIDRINELVDESIKKNGKEIASA